MPRYVDIENLDLRGITFIDENLDVLIPLSDVRKALQMLPTADVVPRAEVEKIFEEIERHLSPYQIQEDIYTRRAHENGDMCDYQIHQYAEHVISHTLDYFAELKKKYIGE